jgi:hypothetical protein
MQPTVSMTLSRARFGLLALPLIALPGCRVVGDIFKAGVWVGVVGFVVLLAVIGWIVSLVARR